MSWHTLGELVRWAALHPWPRPSDPPPPVPGRLGRDLAATRRDPVGRWAWLCVAVGLALIGITARWPVPRGYWASYLRRHRLVGAAQPAAAASWPPRGVNPDRTPDLKSDHQP